jgi:hypothetical protein
MSDVRFRRRFDVVLKFAPNCRGTLRLFYPDGNLFVEKVSRDILHDLLLIEADWSSPLRQATSFAFSPAPF